MKKTIVLLITSIILVIVSVSTVVFAWFSIVEKTREIIIYSGKLELSSILYDISNDVNTEITEISFDKVVAGDEFKYMLVINNLESSMIGSLDIKFLMEFDLKLANLININFMPGSNISPINSYMAISNHILDQTNKELVLYFDIKFSNDITLNEINTNFIITQIEITFSQVTGGNGNEEN